MKCSQVSGIRKFCTLLFLSIVLPVTMPAVVAAAVKQKRNHITNFDKAQIVKSILSKQVLLERELRTNEVRGMVYLSTENLNASLLPRIRGVKLILLPPNEIETKEAMGFGHFVFKEFRVRSGRKVEVTFWEVWKNSSQGAGDLRKLTYEYQKVNGRWRGKQISESFSVR